MEKDFERFDCKNLFNRALKDGINLFCGAGFSVEAKDSKKNILPVGNMLLADLKKEFPTISTYTNLPRACTKLEKTDKSSFYNFLNARFSVRNFDKLYLELLKINIRNIYTTNIDDLFFKIYGPSTNTYYLNDKGKDGDSFNDKFAIDYYALHGCVRHGNDYVFGTTEIASAFSQRGTEKSWNSLAKDSSNHPILFWGWNFEDAGPIEAMFGNGNDTEHNINKWVLLFKPTNEIVDFLSSLRFNIIIGDTKQMLEYLEDYNKIDHIDSYDYSINDNERLKALSSYLPPKNDKELTSYSFRSYFIDYTPRWSHIYSHNIPRTLYYKKTADLIASENNIIVIGIRGSGKTTLMMQLLADLDSKKQKHLMIAPSREQAKVYLKLIGEYKSLLFVDDCFRDTDAIIELLKAKNVQVVCFDRDFNYERQFHKIEREKFQRVDITEINQEDAQSIVDVIPTDLKKYNSNTRNFYLDPTIPNLLAKNLRAVNFNFINNFYNKDELAAEVFLLICYVHSCGVPCSFDMIYSYLGDENYNWGQMLNAVERSGGLVKDYSEYLGAYDPMYSLQNYYQCRSRYFAEKIISSIPTGNKIFARMLLNFVLYVPTFKICQYDKFRRSGFDADFATKAFPDPDDGEYYYDSCLLKDETEYIYQQAAIYFSRLKEYKKAFDWIDRARNLSHYNRFSIDSTYAKIYFDVNLTADRLQTQDALDILCDCCKRDQRKAIHFVTFSKCALQYHEKYNDTESIGYIKSALSFVDEGIKDSNMALSQKNKLELKNIGDELRSIIKSYE